MKPIDALAREVRSAWIDLLAARKTSNDGYTVKTDRGAERMFTIQATERDLDDLAELLERLAKP